MLQYLRDRFDQVRSKVTQEKKVNLLVPEFQGNSLFQAGVYGKYLKNKVISQLNQFIGRKVLVLDSFVSEMLNIVIESMQLLRENGVEEIYYIDSDQLEVECTQIAFFVSPDRAHMRRIVRIIRNNQLHQQSKRYMLIFCPRANIICKEYLEKEAVKGDLILQNFNFDLIQLQSDLFSLELNGFTRQTSLNNDLTYLQIVAESIQRLELVHGKFNNIYAKGSFSRQVIDILKQRQTIEDFADSSKSKLHSLLIVDRRVDLITPQLTPFTYEAMIDEIFTIRHNQIDLEKVGPDLLKDRVRMMRLSDPNYHQVKNLNIKLAMRTLEEKRQVSKSMLQSMKVKDQQRTMAELNQFIQKARQLPKEMNVVLDHLIVCSHINKVMEEILFNLRVNQEVNLILQTKLGQVEQMIENLIHLQEPIESVLKLFSLYCQLGPVKSKFYDYVRREIIHVYGLEYLQTLRNCERMGLIGLKLGENVWERVEKPLRLINENVDHDQPEDFSYVYLAYAPLIVRLFEEIIVRNGWSNILPAVKELPGEIVIQQNLLNLPPCEDPQLYIVFFVGGVTYGEICAVRWLAQRYQKDIVVCTTHVTSGSRLIADMK